MGPRPGDKGQRVIRESVAPSWDRINLNFYGKCQYNCCQLSTTFGVLLGSTMIKTHNVPATLSIYTLETVLCVCRCMHVWILVCFVTFHWKCLSWQLWINDCVIPDDYIPWLTSLLDPSLSRTTPHAYLNITLISLQMGSMVLWTSQRQVYLVWTSRLNLSAEMNSLWSTEGPDFMNNKIQVGICWKGLLTTLYTRKILKLISLGFPSLCPAYLYHLS